MQAAVAVQLDDADKRVHQAEARALTVRCCPAMHAITEHVWICLWPAMHAIANMFGSESSRLNMAHF